MTGLSFDLTEEQEQLRQTVRDFADRECPKRYLPAVAAGDLRFAFAMTEPAGGTDVLRAMTTKAFPADGGYIGPITNEMARNYIGESLGLPRSF